MYVQGGGVGCESYIPPLSDFIIGEFFHAILEGGGVIFLKDRGVQLLKTLF